MGLFSSLFGRGYSKSLSASQFEAVLTSLYFVALSDGQLNDEELGALGDALDETPWCAAYSEGDVEASYTRAAKRAQSILREDSTDESIAADLSAISAELGTDDVREQVIRMALAVAAGDDEIVEDETVAVSVLGRAFGISEERFTEIVEK